MNQKKLTEICENVNEKVVDCNIKAGVSGNESIVIYDSETYDELFGYQVVGIVPVDKVETKHESLKVETEVLTKIAEISGMAIWTAVQKS
jgi:hypothetical protein